MDIRFCDLCNESVPEPDLAAGKAFLRKGRVICASCDAAMGGGGTDEANAGAQTLVGTSASTSTAVKPPPTQATHTSSRRVPSQQEVAASHRPAHVPPAAHASHDVPAASGAGKRTATLALVLGVGAVSAVGFGGSLLLDRLEGLEGRVVQTQRGVDASLRTARTERIASVEPLRRRIDDVSQESRAAAEQARMDAEARVAELENAFSASAEREAELRTMLDESRLRVERLRSDAAEARAEAAEAMATLEQVVAFHGDQLIELQERIRQAGALASSGGMGPDPAVAQANAPSWQRHLADLKSPDEGIRLDAVFALGDTGDTAVIEHVIPMLKDSDIFVRMVAAQALDDLRAKTAVPALIDALGDDRSPVREAAVIALRNITGQSFGFDPAARDADRRKRVDQWRAWWRRSGDDFLTS
ncbi:MAG: HEAT repeat domain-containing protein [Planctomycetota bacterium]